MNISVTKQYSKKNLISINLKTTNPYRSYADSEYDKKKLKEKKEVHEQILRVSLQTTV